jgi:PAS domain S-box-containing protein
MRGAAVQPTGQERTFGEHEIIVTKTDPRGILTYANDIFLRISALREDEAIGQPHNIIRHPDMPRCVFKLLWDTIAQGNELFAYVINLARDGAHYWVLAHVTPSFAGGRIVGYHSSRRLPDRSAVAEVGALYAKLRAAEQRHPGPADAVEAGMALLQEEIATRAGSYDEFVWSLNADVTAAAR